MKNRIYLKSRINKEIRILNVTEKTIAGLGDNVKLESKTALLDSIILVYIDVDIDSTANNANNSGNSGNAIEKERREEGDTETGKLTKERKQNEK